MLYLDLINDLLCAACCLRLILFTRSHQARRPWASALAYLLIVAFAALAILPWMEWSLGSGLAQLLLNSVLAGALFTVRGNVMALFKTRPGQRPSAFLRILQRKTWRRG